MGAGTDKTGVKAVKVVVAKSTYLRHQEAREEEGDSEDEGKGAEVAGKNVAPRV
jgi:hypothetical protein